jgi:predicted aminopeptidase
MIQSFFLFGMLFLYASCARVGVGYLADQGAHQLKIQWKGVKNEKILADPKASEEVKRKILLIGEYKKFFYHHFNEKTSSIYSKTTMLDSKAVTYLLIATPHNKIEPYEFKFPFVGSFPYIGFFELKAAKKFAKELEKDELVTWIRPVYAYSTLGYLEDRILSSFFHYDDVELAELIFHELFHTIFFIKDEVDLNENLANLYGRELLQEYFKDRPELKEYLATQEKIVKKNARIVELIEILKAEFNKLGLFLTNEKADLLTKRFVDEVFRPEIFQYCEKILLDSDDCEIKDDWNQAAFAALMTYEEEQDLLENLKSQLNLDLKNFLAWLREEYKIYKKENKLETFTDYLKLKVKNAPTAIN